ncbi:uncharacterized protein LOC126981779 isoform X2 [Eriocheir sinensis]|uniref:uncharacterized protein LOC126981779 isoform X2 n=1 Tax=Eriocheir sinensis TaxID=95602 RepID=UPI0021C5FC33|nr:uncharacterized protein LOC126981779 isoform X2 [Eriocheir sinensis]
MTECVWLMVLLVVISLPAMLAFRPRHSNDGGEGGGGAVAAVVGAAAPGCAVILISSGGRLHSSYVKVLFGLKHTVATFEVSNDEWNVNVTRRGLAETLQTARFVRRRSQCVVVVVVSEDYEFLVAFAQWSLKARLLSGTTKLLVLTRLPFYRVENLLCSYWTLSMMNAMLLNQEGEDARFLVYVHLPFSQAGSQVKRIASWGSRPGLVLRLAFPLFPDKFSNFHGTTVNVTALPYTPHWVEETNQSEDGTSKTVYSGTDYYLLASIAYALNFTIHVIPTPSWNEVALKVEERKSFMATVFHNVLPQRLERYDYSYTYEYGSLDFSVAKPSLKPRWQSLYYPLSNSVWLAVIAIMLIVPLSLYLLCLPELTPNSNRLGFGIVVQMVIATFLSQNLTKKLPQFNWSRCLMAAWLVFALVVGTVYRGNLTAALTLPKYPPRTETVQQLVNTFTSITMPPFGNEFIKFFKQSNSTLYKSLADKMSIVPDVITGLQRAQDYREAHVAGRRYMEQMIARHFTSPLGSTPLYVGRESLLPGISAWPIPHDAPYKHRLDTLMMAVVEAGMYEKWSEDMLGDTRRKARARQRSGRTDEEEQNDGGEGGGSVRALTMVHLQGPILLLLLCLAAATLAFAAEYVLNTRKNKTSSN